MPKTCGSKCHGTPHFTEPTSVPGPLSARFAETPPPTGLVLSKRRARVGRAALNNCLINVQTRAGAIRSAYKQSDRSMHRTALAFAAIIAFAASAHAGSQPSTVPTVSDSPSAAIMQPARWTIGPVIDGMNYSVDMPPHPSAKDGWSFEFPAPPGSVHYVTTPAPPLTIGQSISITFEVRGAGRLLAVQRVPRPGLLRLHIQREGDDWTGEGPYQHYRFWSRPIKLSQGTRTLTVPLEPVHWTGVFGKKNRVGFEEAVANAALIGFSFGHSAAGHGVYRTSKEPVRFILKSFAVQ